MIFFAVIRIRGPYYFPAHCSSLLKKQLSHHAVKTSTVLPEYPDNFSTPLILYIMENIYNMGIREGHFMTSLLILFSTTPQYPHSPISGCPPPPISQFFISQFFISQFFFPIRVPPPELRHPSCATRVPLREHGVRFARFAPSSGLIIIMTSFLIRGFAKYHF